MKDFIVGTLAAALLVWLPNKVGETTTTYHPFGPVKIFKNPSEESTGVVILISGKNGWTHSENDLAYGIASEKNLVIGIDFTKYTHSNCKLNSSGEAQTLSADLIALTKTTEQLLKFKTYISPSVLAFQEAGSLAMSIALDTRDDNFLSVNSVDSCFRPQEVSSCSKLNQPVHPVNIFIDERTACTDLKTLNQFKLKNIQVFKVSDLGMNPFKLKNWSHEMKSIWRAAPKQNRELARAHKAENQVISLSALDDLPLIVSEPTDGISDKFVILYSGDGGWSDFTQELAAEYLKHGYPVVGISSLFYFWNPKTPEIGAEDLSKIILHYQKQFNIKKFIITGFSFGAETLPFFLARIDKSKLNGLQEVSLLAPGQNAEFKFNISNWLQDNDTGEPILPSIEKLKGTTIKCVYSEGDRPSVCSKLKKSNTAKSYLLKGGHHFNNNFEQFDKILW